MCAELEEEFGDMTARKRDTEAAANANPQNQKKLKLDASVAHQIDIAEMGGEHIGSCPLANIAKTNNVCLHFRTGGIVYITNETPDEVVLYENLHIAGFPTKNAKFDKKATSPDLSIPFTLTDQDTEVISGTVLTTVSALIEEKRKTDPRNAKVCFHVMAEEPSAGRPGNFSLKCRQELFFNQSELMNLSVTPAAAEPDEGQPTLSQGVAAAVVSVRKWLHNDLLKVLWVVKWKTKGLVPVCPKVVMKVSVKLLPGKALKVV